MPKTRRPKNFRRKRRSYRKRAPVATKKDLMQLRSKLVETKAREQEKAASATTASEDFFLSSAGAGTALINKINTGWHQGLSESSFAGDEVTLKYLTQKLRFRFPDGANSIVKPYRLQVIWGFITRPAGFNAFVPAGQATDSNLSRKHFEDLAEDIISEPFNTAEDDMNFRVKKKTLYRIIGKKWVKPNRNNQISMTVSANNLGAAGVAGSVPDVKMQISWPVKGKKWRLTYSADSHDPGKGAPDPGLGAQPFWYNNENHIPFTVLYSPDYANVNNGEYAADADKVLVSHNCKCWFTDS